jgi:hypothetical protein
MSPVNIFVARDGAAQTSTPSNITPAMFNLLIALVVLFATIALLVSGLLVLRTYRNRQKQQQDVLPSYQEGSRRSLIRSTLTINAPAYVAREKQNLMDNSFSPPGSPIPEIRITFPEEVDDAGKRKSGRVVVVRVGEHTVGMEPVNENLPPYQQSESDRFQSLDLERMGGLKEKESSSSDKRWS